MPLLSSAAPKLHVTSHCTPTSTNPVVELSSHIKDPAANIGIMHIGINSEKHIVINTLTSNLHLYVYRYVYVRTTNWNVSKLSVCHASGHCCIIRRFVAKVASEITHSVSLDCSIRVSSHVTAEHALRVRWNRARRNQC